MSARFLAFCSRCTRGIDHAQEKCLCSKKACLVTRAIVRFCHAKWTLNILLMPVLPQFSLYHHMCNKDLKQPTIQCPKPSSKRGLP
eukprot:5157013-Amphidinium_carterae.1